MRGAEGPEGCTKYNWLSQRHYLKISIRLRCQRPQAQNLEGKLFSSGQKTPRLIICNIDLRMRGAEGPEHCTIYNWLSQTQYLKISNRVRGQRP